MGLPPRLMSIDEALVLFTLFFLIFILFCFFLAFFSQIKRISPDRLTTVQTWAVPQYIHTVYYGLNLHVMTEVLLQPPLQTLMHSSMWLHFHWFFSYFILFLLLLFLVKEDEFRMTDWLQCKAELFSYRLWVKYPYNYWRIATTTTITHKEYLFNESISNESMMVRPLLEVWLQTLIHRYVWLNFPSTVF